MSVNPALLGIVSSIAELVTAHTVQENIKSKNKLADSVFKDTPAKSPESIRDSTNHLFQDSGVRATPKIAPWGEMTSFELTSSNEKDIQALTLREFTDPKRFYRKNTIHSRKSAGPTKFQFGVVVAGAQEFYSSRVPTKKRSKSFMDELIRDKSTRKYLKKNIVELHNSKPAKKRQYRVPRGSKRI